MEPATVPVMDTVIAILAHPVPTTALLALGGFATWHGVRLGAAACAPGLRGLLRTMFLARGLRLAMLGLCTIAVAVGAVAGSSSTIGVAMVIAGEEMLEITAVLATLRWGEKHGL